MSSEFRFYGSGIQPNGPTVVEFEDEVTVNVNHGLGFYPVVNIFDTSGNEVEADWQNISSDSFVVIFNQATSGKILYR